MKSLFRFVGLILKGIWKAITFIRLALTNLIFLLSIGIIYFIYIHADAPLPTMDKSSALVLNLSDPIVEQSTHINPMDSFTGSVFGEELPAKTCCLILLKPYAMRKMTTMSPGLCWL